MANRDYGERGRGWERDVEDRYGRGYYARGTTGEENWIQRGASPGYAEPSGLGWEREGWGREGRHRGRYAGERGSFAEPYTGREWRGRESWSPEAWGRERARGVYYDREPYSGVSSPEGSYFGGRSPESYIGYGAGAYGSYGGTEFGEGRRRTFVGRGPKGWRRADERIGDEVSEALARHPDIDASELEVTVASGVVTLTGVVEDRHEKRLAEDIAEDVFGVADVENKLKVRHGLLARLTGEKVDEREVARGVERETPGATGARTSGTRATGRPSGTAAT